MKYGMPRSWHQMGNRLWKWIFLMMNSRTALGTQCFTEGTAHSAAPGSCAEEVACGKVQMTRNSQLCRGQGHPKQSGSPRDRHSLMTYLFVWEASSWVEGQAAQKEREVVQNQAEEFSRTSSLCP